jgi:hypothetical protein
MEAIEQLDHVSGQVHSLIGFALAVIRTHPDPSLLAKHLAMADLAATGRASAQLVSDDFLGGMAEVASLLKDTVEREAARRT